VKTLYALPHINLPTKYFDTLREARRAWRAEEEPERIVVVDAAAQCNGLERSCDDLERRNIALFVALRDLVAVAPLDTLRDTAEGRAVVVLLRQLDPDFVRDCGL
jgi:uncharacterized protein YdeI (YjbR/CyaY-like superfamily)